MHKLCQLGPIRGSLRASCVTCAKRWRSSVIARALGGIWGELKEVKELLGVMAYI